MQLHYNPAFGLYSFLASDGRAYAVKDFASINNVSGETCDPDNDRH